MGNKKSIKKSIVSLLLVAIALIGMIQLNVPAEEVYREYPLNTTFENNGNQYLVIGDNLYLLGDMEDPNYVMEEWVDSEEQKLRRTNRLYYITNAGRFIADAAYHGSYGYEFPGNSTFIYRTEVEKEKTYVFSMWVKVPKGSDANFSDTYRHIATTLERVGYIEIGRKTPITYGEWQKEEIIFVAKDTEFRFYVVNTGNDVMYIDCLNLQEVQVIESPIVPDNNGPTIKQGSSPASYLSGRGFKAGDAVISYDITHKLTSDTTLTMIVGLYDNLGRLVRLGSAQENFNGFNEKKTLSIRMDIPEAPEEEFKNYNIKIFLVDTLQGLDKFVPTEQYNSEGKRAAKDLIIGGYNIISIADSGLTLTLPNPNADALSWSERTEADNQQWFIYEKSPNSGIYYIYSKANPERFLNNSGHSRNTSTSIIAWKGDYRDTNEEWAIEVVDAEAKTYRLKNVESGYYLAKIGKESVIQHDLANSAILYIEGVR